MTPEYKIMSPIYSLDSKKNIHVSSAIVLYYNIPKPKTSVCAMLIDLSVKFFFQKNHQKYAKIYWQKMHIFLVMVM